MCVSVAPARFASTIVYAGEARNNGEVVHVAAYQNVAQSLAGPAGAHRWLDRVLGRPAAPTGNAMVLHFPAIVDTMTQDNVVDTERCPSLLRDMVTALAPPVANAQPSGGLGRAKAVEVFESGIYTVVLASDARAIPGALDRVPDRKRPPLNTALFDWYHATFPGWPVALCCFDNTDRARATPMLWWYRPAYPDWLFAPAVDAHTGAVPDLGARVAVDHWVIAGSSEMAAEHGAPVRYRDEIPDHVAPYVPDRVVGAYFRGLQPNADFVSPVAAVREGRDAAERRMLAA